MILTTHGIVGASVATALVVANPTPSMLALGTVLATLSHFGLDALPHWDYPLGSASLDSTKPARVIYDRQFFKDLIKVGVDMSLGVIFALSMVFIALPHEATLSLKWYMLAAALLGAFGGMLPDFMQFFYMRKPSLYWLAALQRFHMWIHTPIRLRGHRAPFGIVLQVCILLCIVAAFVNFVG